MVIILAIATLLKPPPKDWQPRQTATSSASTQAIDYPAQILKSRSFYGLWICYAIASFVGLSAIGISSSVGEEVIQINPTLAANSVSLFALFNGMSRPLFGWLCDRTKPHYVAIGSYTLILIASIMMIGAQKGQVATDYGASTRRLKAVIAKLLLH